MHWMTISGTDASLDSFTEYNDFAYTVIGAIGLNPLPLCSIVASSMSR